MLDTKKPPSKVGACILSHFCLNGMICRQAFLERLPILTQNKCVYGEFLTICRFDIFAVVITENAVGIDFALAFCVQKKACIKRGLDTSDKVAFRKEKED